jgi:hypothetical protein
MSRRLRARAQVLLWNRPQSTPETHQKAIMG